MDADDLLALLEADLDADGPVTMVGIDQAEVEEAALALVREHAPRAMDAWHLAVASLALPTLAEPDEAVGFASRDDEQAAVAEDLGFTLW